MFENFFHDLLGTGARVPGPNDFADRNEYKRYLKSQRKANFVKSMFLILLALLLLYLTDKNKLTSLFDDAKKDINISTQNTIEVSTDPT